MSALWSRMTGRGAVKKTLPADLKRITHSEVMEIPKELLTPVIEASINEEDRLEIMRHLRECLAEPTGKHWRRIHGGLVLTEALVQSGSPALIWETAQGRHFDLVQRLSFLEHFENVDKRVQNSLRRKAEALRKEVVPLLQNASEKEAEDCKDTASTCSPGAVSTITESTTTSVMAATGFGSDDICGDMLEAHQAEASKRIMILNNIVAVGHNDDTTSESEGGEDRTRAVQYREPRKMTTKERNARSRRGESGSSDSDDASKEKGQRSNPSPQADLLDF